MKRKEDFKPMDVYFALFNGHVNNAFDRAKRTFIKEHSKKGWDVQIAPFHKRGIMSIFQAPPTPYTVWYTGKVQEFVNNGRELAVVAE